MFSGLQLLGYIYKVIHSMRPMKLYQCYTSYENYNYLLYQVLQLSPVAYSIHFFTSLVPRPSITANEVEGLVKLLRRMTSGGHLEAWHFR